MTAGTGVCIVLVAFCRTANASPCTVQMAPEECNAKLGDDSLAAKDYEAAAGYFKQSFELSHRTSTLAMYGHALLWARHYDRAKAALTDARKRLSDTVAADPTKAVALATLIAQVSTDLEDLNNRTVIVHLRYAGGTPPPHLTVARKGEGDLAQPFKEPVLMAGGSDTLIVSYPDGSSIEIQVSAPPGTISDKTIPVRNPVIVTPEKKRFTWRWIGVGLLGVAVVGTVVGVMEYRASANTLSDLGCFEVANGGLSCTGDAAAGQRAADRQTRSERVLVGAGVLAIAGMVLVAINPGNKTSTSTTTRLRVDPTAQGAVIGFAGRF